MLLDASREATDGSVLELKQGRIHLDVGRMILNSDEADPLGLTRVLRLKLIRKRRNSGFGGSGSESWIGFILGG